jgi:hypothetical protein
LFISPLFFTVTEAKHLLSRGPKPSRPAAVEAPAPDIAASGEEVTLEVEAPLRRITGDMAHV